MVLIKLVQTVEQENAMREQEGRRLDQELAMLNELGRFQHNGALPSNVVFFS